MLGGDDEDVVRSAGDGDRGKIKRFGIDHAVRRKGKKFSESAELTLLGVRVVSLLSRPVRELLLR